MRTEDPLIFSILTTHLNQGYFLGEALASALSQEGAFYIDYILVDAGSTDNTQQVLGRMEKQMRETCAVAEYRGLAFYAPGEGHLPQGEIKVRCLGVSLRDWAGCGPQSRAVAGARRHHHLPRRR